MGKNCLCSLCNNSIYAYIIQVKFNLVGDYMLNYEEIGKRIRVLRKQKNLSQEQLAEKVWISTTHMSHIETGSTKLSLPVLVDLANALEVGTDEILATPTSKEKTVALEGVEEILKSCTQSQAKVICEIIKSAKKAMDQFLQ